MGREDTGRYLCVAGNGVGNQASAVISLTVLRKLDSSFISSFSMPLYLSIPRFEKTSLVQLCESLKRVIADPPEIKIGKKLESNNNRLEVK